MWTALGCMLVLGCSCSEPEHSPVPAPEPAPKPPDETTPTDFVDNDGDGFSTDMGDCNDNNAAIHPFAAEVCDGVDTDCNGTIEDDADGDGALWCNECDDTDPNLSPTAPDPYGDELDTNCDGTDGVGTPSDRALVGESNCGQLGWSIDPLDADGDGRFELAVGAPYWNTHCTHPVGNDRVYLLSDTEVLGHMQGIRNQLNGFHVEAFQTFSGLHRIASVATLEEEGTIRVYNLSGRAFVDGPQGEGSPHMEVRGTALSHAAGIAADEAPAKWLAVTAVVNTLEPTNTTFIGLFNPDETGSWGIHDAPNMIVSSNKHFSTGQWSKAVGDRNGDGLVELGVSAPAGDGENDWVGRAYILTPGFDGVLEEGLETWRGTTYEHLTGHRIRGGADLDGDGLPELAISSPSDHESRGRIDIAPWLGPGTYQLNEHALASVTGEFQGDWASEAALVDADADGFGDLVVGLPGYQTNLSPGKAMLFFGPIQGQLNHQHADRVWVGPGLESFFGYELAVADVDGSGLPDLIVGAPHQDSNLPDVGAVHFIYDFGL